MKSKRRLICSHVVKYQVASTPNTNAMLACLEVGHHVLVLVAILRCVPHIHRVFIALSASSLGTLVSACKLNILFLDGEFAVSFTNVLGQSLDMDRLLLQQSILIDSGLIGVVGEEAENGLSIGTNDGRRKHGVQMAVANHSTEQSGCGWRGQIEVQSDRLDRKGGVSLL